MKIKLFGKTLSELQEIVLEYGLPKFTAMQIASWLYKKEITSIDEMTNISKANRLKLAENFEFGVVLPIKETISEDGTKKYLYPVEGNKYIETAMIPEKDRATICVSSQKGCKMGCKFCMTARQGFQGHLTTGEIVNQLRSLPERDKISNIVYMGMGEPFDNIDRVLKSLEILTSDWGFAMSPQRINVSSIGVIPSLKRFLAESNCRLAISLHSPFDDERLKIMPVQKIHPMKEMLQVIREHDFGRQRRVSFEYIVLKDYNDTQRHADELAKILNGINCRINLIKFHDIPGAEFPGTSPAKIEVFKNMLLNKGIMTTLRKSRGEDIDAACGLLSTSELNKQKA